MALINTLSWSQFLAKVTSVDPGSLGLEELERLVRSLDARDPAFQEFVYFQPETYARNLVFKDETLEVLCLCWHGQQRSSIHNHGSSFGVVLNIQGLLCEEIFDRQEDGQLTLRLKRDISAGSITTAPVGVIHRQGNAGDPNSRLVSLHFYVTPLAGMEAFDPQTGAVEWREPLPYTLTPVS